MKDFHKITEFEIELNRDIVFHLIDCYPSSPIYEEVIKEYGDIYARVVQSIHPKAFYKYENGSKELSEHSEGVIVEGASLIYVLMTIGDEITEISSEYFAQGDYLLGMLVNAMADSYLFQLEEIVKDNIKVSCIENHVGIEKRLDAPSDIPMVTQKDILDEIKTRENLSIEVTEGFMFTTIKTMGYLLILTEDEAAVYSGHHCSSCSQRNCKIRKA